MNLHELMQGMKVCVYVFFFPAAEFQSNQADVPIKLSDIEWLAPKGLEKQRMSQTDVRKRREIFAEFLYYLVDSLLIPLVRSNFYVTESNLHRYRLFFFRHDVWRYIAEPAMASLKARMFEEVKLEDALQILGSRQLGFSQIRLLPKEATMRPIMNLRRRALPKRGRKILGPSINSVLGPIHSVLNLEKVITGYIQRNKLLELTDRLVDRASRAAGLDVVLGRRHVRTSQSFQASLGRVDRF